MRDWTWGAGMTQGDSMALDGKILDSSAAGVSTRAVLRGPVLPDLIRDELLAEIFAASVARFPQKPCLKTADQSLSYAEVDARATTIARGLLRLGAKPGRVIGLWMPRGPDLLIAQIAIAKTGAAWLPFDADAPLERIAVCLSDSEATALLTSSAQINAASAGVVCPVVSEETLSDPADTSIVDARALGASPEHPAYMIYTSGSTGVPKGIVITGHNICHFLRSANELYGLIDNDVMFQGASVAFDLSMEEIWVPYMVGATLFVATPAMMGEADRLPDLMESAGVTVLDTVPTLLAMLPRDVATLRIILLGGEACPPSIADRWGKPGRAIFNTYGPTEATVVATAGIVRAGQPVTIGGPIANYTCYVADDSLNLLARDVEGELLIGGPGVAKGYLKRDELTAEKFIPNPFSNEGSDPILYRSGDAVAINAQGDILFRGRIDDQVKIRGFRVELGEIETKLAAQPNVAQAAVVLRNDDGLDQLVAFLVPATGADVDTRTLRSALRQTLPAYMVPARYEPLAELPRLSSGKVNRNQLKQAELSAPSDSADEQEEPRTPTETKLLAAAKAVLPPQAIPFEADFFTDLGGHSLLAARFLGLVRKHPEIASLTLQDVYAARNLRAMGALLDARPSASGVPADLTFAPPPLLRRFLCGLAQLIALPFIIALVTLQWLGLFIASVFFVLDGVSAVNEAIALFGLYLAINLGTKATIVIMKWVVVGRTKPGRYPLWGAYYFRLWFVQRMVQITTMKFLQCSPLMRIYLRLLGAKVGKDAIISEFESGAIDMLTFGDGASTGLKCRFSTFEVIGNEVIVGPITISADCHVGNSCVIGPGATLEQGAELADLTSIPGGATIASYERWDGSPARKAGMVDQSALPEFPQAGPLRRGALLVGYIVGYVVMLMIGLVPIFPAFYVLYNLDSVFTGIQDSSLPWSDLLFLAWPTSFVLIVISMAIIVALRWIILPRVGPGMHSIHSWFYYRKWLMGLATEVTLETLNSLYATLYMRFWYRLMGAKIGKGSEISTNLAGRYDLVEIGDNNFLGDEVIFGDEEIRRGWMTLKRVKTGDRVFLGNDAVVSQGADLGDGTLVGIKSKLPDSLKTDQNAICFGSPAMILPNRQKVKISDNFTYEPPPGFIFVRGAFEALHTSLPTAMFITMGYIAADIMSDRLDSADYLGALGVFMASGLIIAVLLIIFSAIIKWLVIGVYEPVMKPMWSWWAMRTEAVAVLYGGLVGKASLEYMRGTPFMPWLLRLYGTRIGKGVYMDCTDLTEFDCVTIGDFCVLNDHSVLQTHLYEDRIMKVGRCEIARGVSVGPGTTVLYDTHVGEFAQLGQLTIVMKGESIQAHSKWAGAPAQPMVDVHAPKAQAAE